MPNFHERDKSKPTITYLRFPTSFWMQHERNLAAFVTPLFDFVDRALGKGENVLVHCLAGAHRAGTTGCLLLMYKAAMSPAEAIRCMWLCVRLPVHLDSIRVRCHSAAQRLRPVIDPIGSLPQLLQKYSELRKAGKIR
mmetsp:Transcript_37390/g.84703  ORF Transcript_37390/g.84703 Transcript_37390/m.84703 type:complete len:138 (-) Transcript_37390:344-757(-)